MTGQSQQQPLHSRKIGEIAATVPGATEVFRKLKLDFCCGGDVTLEEAARTRDVDLDGLEQALAALEEGNTEITPSRTTDEFIDHILTRYHETHRRELPELIRLARKVEAVHRDSPQVPRGLADILQQMMGELEVHMKKEELVLFPAMRQGAASNLDLPITQMRHDHDEQGEYLRQLDTMTGSFTVPDGACRTWQALYAGTAKLAHDLMEHVHLENNVLFPRYH